MAPYFSLIAPVYNTPKDLLKRCIDSILSQTYSDFELLLIDDGSTADCAAFLDSCSESDKRIKVFHKKNEGSSAARNTGIQNAAGAYTSFVDSDDFLMPYMLDDAKKTIDKYAPDMIVGLAQRHYKDTEASGNLTEAFDDSAVSECPEISTFMNHILGYTNPSFKFKSGYIGDGPWARFCKTDIVKETPFGVEGFCSDDTIWNLEILPKCKKLVVVNRLWYMYMINANSKTRKFRPNSSKEVIFRMEQEYHLASSYNHACKKGAFVKIWRETDTFGRSFLFNKKNNIPFSSKLRAFRSFVREPIYRKMLQEISFDAERNCIKRILKEICKHCSLHGPVFVSYFFWLIFVRKSI